MQFGIVFFLLCRITIMCVWCVMYFNLFLDFFSVIGTMMSGVGTIGAMIWAVRNYNLLKSQMDSQAKDREDDKQKDREIFYLGQFSQVIDSLIKFKKENHIVYNYFQKDNNCWVENDLPLSDSFGNLMRMYNEIIVCFKRTEYPGDYDEERFEYYMNEFNSGSMWYRGTIIPKGSISNVYTEDKELQKHFEEEIESAIFDTYGIKEDLWKSCQGKSDEEIKKIAVDVLLENKQNSILSQYAYHICVLSVYVRDFLAASKFTEDEIKEKKKLFYRRFYLQVSGDERAFIWFVLLQKYDDIKYLF